MRVGIYVDGYNLYYGMKSQFVGVSQGWKWLDITALVLNKMSFLAQANYEITRKVFCTAERDQHDNQSALRDQRLYVRRLEESGSSIEYGFYRRKRVRGMLLSAGFQAFNFNDSTVKIPGTNVTGPKGEASKIVSIATFEEKGSDVNLATAFLSDALLGKIDIAVVISNDGDLAGALSKAREFISVILLNPSGKHLTNTLRGERTDGAQGHLWSSLAKGDYLGSQFQEDSEIPCPGEW